MDLTCFQNIKQKRPFGKSDGNGAIFRWTAQESAFHRGRRKAEVNNEQPNPTKQNKSIT